MTQDVEWPALTPRQQQVVELVAQGRSNHEIAAALFLTLDTVKHHVMNACRRCGVQNRTQLAARWLRSGPPDPDQPTR